MSRQLGAATYGYLYSASLDDALTRLADAGFRLVEIMTTPPHLSPDTAGPYMRRRLVRHIRRLGLRVLSLNPTYLDLNLISINDGIRQETTRQLRATLELCHDLEAEMVVVIPGRRHILIPSPFNDASGVLDRELLPLLDYAERLSVRVCLENGPSLFLEKADQVRTVCDRLRHRALAMLFDVANSHMVEPVAHALEGVAASVSLIHLSDTSRKRWAHAPVGRGTVPFSAVAEVLDRLSYQGPSILEVIDGEDPLPGLRASAEALATLGWALE